MSLSLRFTFSGARSCAPSEKFRAKLLQAACSLEVNLTNNSCIHIADSGLMPVNLSRMNILPTAQESDRIELLRRQYLQLLEPGLLAFPGPEMLRRPDVQRQLYEKMFHSENPMFVPDSRYQLRVLKELITRIEDAISDPEEDVGFLYLLLSGLQLWTTNFLCGQRNADHCTS